MATCPVSQLRDRLTRLLASLGPQSASISIALRQWADSGRSAVSRSRRNSKLILIDLESLSGMLRSHGCNTTRLHFAP